MKQLLLSSLLLLTVLLRAAASNVITNEGAWCWFADPRAIHYENAAGTINASYLGYIDVHGNIKATQVDFLTGTRTEVLVRSAFQPDDHNNPTFLVLPDERVMIFYTRHTDEAKIWYRVSVRPGDISQLGEEKYITVKNNTTYPSPFILSDDPQHIYICWRGINWHPTIARITMPDADDNVTIDFGPQQIVQSTGARPYAKYHSNGKDKIYLAYTTGHPDNEQPNWLYFNVIDINHGNGPVLKDIKGTTLKTIANGAFNVNKTSNYLNSYPYTVVDHTANIRNWVWQIALDKDEKPIIAYTHIDNAKTTHVYHYGRWTGAEWRDTWVQYGGHAFHQNWNSTERCYSGGMALDPDNVNDLYLSVPTKNGLYNKEGVYEIWKYTIADDGTVSGSQQITKDSEKNNIRPYILPGSKNSQLRLTWMNGDYYYWMVNRNYPKGYPTRLMCDYDLPQGDTNFLDDQCEDYYDDFDAQSDELFKGTAPFTIARFYNVPDSYRGDIIDAGTLKVTLGTDARLHVSINGRDTVSQNRFYTSDDWANASNGTNGDTHLTKISSAMVTVSYDGQWLQLYRNETLEMKLPVEGLQASLPTVDKTLAEDEWPLLWNKTLSQDAVRRMSFMGKIAPYMPADEVHTDIVLPQEIDGMKLHWQSSNPDIVSNTGIVNLPDEETDVELSFMLDNEPMEMDVTVYPRDIKNNLRTSYDFEEANVYEDGSATKVRDLSGNGNDLQVMGSARVDGTLNLLQNQPTAFSTNGYAIAPAGLLKNMRSYTFLFDAYVHNRGKLPRFFDFGSGSGNSVFMRLTSSFNFSAGVKYNGGTTVMVESRQTMPQDSMVHFAVTFNAADHRMRIYANGELVAEGTNVTAEPWQLVESAQDKRNYIGRTQWWDNNSDNGDLVGKVDNFRLYDIALTQEEIREQNVATGITGVRTPSAERKVYTLGGQFVGNKLPETHGIFLSEGSKYVR